MRQVLVSRARARLRVKRGSGEAGVELGETRVPGGNGAAEAVLALHRALSGLRADDPRLAAIFECRYFGGLSEEETAEALGLSLRRAKRGWVRGLGWLPAGLAGGVWR